MAVVRRSQVQTPNTKKFIYYSDVSSNLNTHPNTKDISIIENEDSVKSSIRNILLTRRGERFFNPLFGSDIYSVLFENSSAAAELDLRDYVTNAIENFEPRAKLLRVDVTAYPDDNGYTITIVFSVINKTEPVQMNILLDRIR